MKVQEKPRFFSNLQEKILLNKQSKIYLFLTVFSLFFFTNGFSQIIMSPNTNTLYNPSDPDCYNSCEYPFCDCPAFASNMKLRVTTNTLVGNNGQKCNVLVKVFLENEFVGIDILDYGMTIYFDDHLAVSSFSSCIDATPTFNSDNTICVGNLSCGGCYNSPSSGLYSSCSVTGPDEYLIAEFLLSKTIRGDYCGDLLISPFHINYNADFTCKSNGFAEEICICND